MEVLIGFISSLIKIGILSSAYALLTLLLFILIGILAPNSWFDRVSSNKRQVWFISHLVYTCGLFIYLFTYWGFHGFGDEPRIPIGHGLIIDNTNWTEYGYVKELKTADTIMVETTKFTIVDDKLIGNLNSGFYEYKNSYFIYDMKTEKMLEFKTEVEFNKYTKTHNLTSSDKLQTFRENYWNYWGGWRFWLLA